jgi:ATP phosphoribosyltransferase
LERIIKLVPGMRSPTILKLAKEGEFAVHAVVDKDKLSDLIHKLKKAGARDILVMGTERIIP